MCLAVGAAEPEEGAVSEVLLRDNFSWRNKHVHEGVFLMKHMISAHYGVHLGVTLAVQSEYE